MTSSLNLFWPRRIQKIRKHNHRRCIICISHKAGPLLASQSIKFEADRHTNMVQWWNRNRWKIENWTFSKKSLWSKPLLLRWQNDKKDPTGFGWLVTYISVCFLWNSICRCYMPRNKDRILFANRGMQIPLQFFDLWIGTPAPSQNHLHKKMTNFLSKIRMLQCHFSADDSGGVRGFKLVSRIS